MTALSISMEDSHGARSSLKATCRAQIAVAHQCNAGRLLTYMSTVELSILSQLAQNLEMPYAHRAPAAPLSR